MFLSGGQRFVFVAVDLVAEKLLRSDTLKCYANIPAVIFFLDLVDAADAIVGSWFYHIFIRLVSDYGQNDHGAIQVKLNLRPVCRDTSACHHVSLTCYPCKKYH